MTIEQRAQAIASEARSAIEFQWDKNFAYAKVKELAEQQLKELVGVIVTNILEGIADASGVVFSDTSDSISASNSE